MFFVVPHTLQRLRATFFRLLIPVFLIGLPGITITATSAFSSYKNTIEWQYKQANDYYYTLRNNPSLAGKRKKWLTGIHELQRIYRIDPKSTQASSCLYTIARMYRTMHERFGHAADLEKAISFYKDVVTFFPKGNKADNALYALAQIEQEKRGNFKQAVHYYDQLMHSYPKSNKRRMVKQQLAKLVAILEKNPEKYQRGQVEPPLITPEKKSALPSVPQKPVLPAQVKQTVVIEQKKIQKNIQEKKTPPRTKIVLSALKKVEGIKEKPKKIDKVDTNKHFLKKIPGTADVLPVQYWSSDNYTRVVIKSSDPVEYRVNLIDQHNKAPQRLLIDFQQSYIPAQYRSPVAIQDGLLQHIHTSQLNPTTVRVSLDTKSIGDYKVFNLKDPFRVVVDVRGGRGRALRAPQKKVAPQIITDIKAPVLPLTSPIAAQETKKQEESKASPSTTTLPVEVSTTHGPTEKTAIKLLTPRGRKTVPPLVAAQQSQKNTVPESLTLAQQLGLGVHRIVIDPGHGGKDPGAVAFGLKEKDIVLDVAKKIRNTLKEKKGYEVFLTREDDVSLSLEERTAIANTKEADLFLSIHVNAHPETTIRGVETFYLNLATHPEAMRVAALENATSTHNMSEMQDILSELMQNEKINESSQLAEFIQLNMVSGLKKERFFVKDLGVKQAPFYVLIGAEMPAILAELSFITNPEDAQLMKSEKYLQTLADHIVAGVLSYADNQRTAALQVSPSPASSVE